MGAFILLFMDLSFNVTMQLSRAVEPRHMGVYMGIFNFTITIPQIVIGLTGGAIVKYCFASNAVWMLALAGLFMLLAALSVGFVREEAAR